MNKIAFCPICKSSELLDLLPTVKFPQSIAHLRDSLQDKSELHNLTVTACMSCFFLFNSTFNPRQSLEIYSSPNYVVKKAISLNMSSVLNELVATFRGILDKRSTYLEIGAGSAELALHMANLGHQVITVDPTVAAIDSRIIHIQEYFSAEIVRSAIKGDLKLIVGRHIIEHVEDPLSFLQEIYELCNNDTYVYLELPSLDEICNSARFYDLFIDHFGYFFESRIINLIESVGFKVVKVLHMYGQQHFGILFSKTAPQEFKLQAIIPTKNYVQEAAKHFNDSISEVIALLDKENSYYVWGAGAHGNSILMYLSDEILAKCKGVFDRDPQKIGRFMSGKNIQVIAPSLELMENSTILIASALHEDEICKDLISNGLNIKVICTAKKIIKLSNC